MGKIRSDKLGGEIGDNLDQIFEARGLGIETRHIRGLHVPDAFRFVVIDRDRELHGKNMEFAPITVHEFVAAAGR